MVQTIKHLGHTLSCCLDFYKDVILKKGSFIGCVNDVLTEFAFAHPHVKCKLVQIYGTCFYGSPLWDLYGISAKSLYKTWNIAIRKLYDLPYRAHTRFLDNISGASHLSISLKMRFIKFVNKLLSSENILINNLINVSLCDNMSPTGLNLSRILSEFDMYSSCYFNLYGNDAQSMILNSYNVVHKLSSQELSICHTITELINCVHGTFTNVLSVKQCKELISVLSTD